MEWQKGKLTTKEAWNNLLEDKTAERTDEELAHFWEVVERLVRTDEIEDEESQE